MLHLLRPRALVKLPVRRLSVTGILDELEGGATSAFELRSMTEAF
jgi:hypothetical protein